MTAYPQERRAGEWVPLSMRPHAHAIEAAGYEWRTSRGPVEYVAHAWPRGAHLQPAYVRFVARGATEAAALERVRGRVEDALR